MDKIELMELEKSFYGRGEVSGCLFEQIDKTIYGYVYRVTHPEGFIHYEAIARKEVKGINPFTGKPQWYIQYPKSSQFGISAWCYKTLSQAREKLYHLSIVHKLEAV